MSDENKLRDAADAIKGIVEAVPVYQDAIQPAAKEVGVALQTIARTIHIALAPISAVVWGYDRIKDYLNEALTERLRNIPKERIVAPDPTVAGPAVEALRFAAHEPSLRELYANLLATSMDAKTAREAHPAFVEILRQLTPDEARILKQASQIRYMPFPMPLISARCTANDINSDVKFVYIEDFVHFSLVGQQANCVYPELAPTYLNNLCRLGLTEILPFDASLFAHAQLDCNASYSPLEQHPRIISEWIPNDGGPFDTKVVITREVLRLTSLGEQFCSACVDERERT